MKNEALEAVDWLVNFRYMREEDQNEVVDDHQQKINIIKSSLEAAPEVVTVEDIIQAIERWRFYEDTDGTFGAYLMKIYPNGLKIVEDKNG
jgi:hypothetical protein